MRLLLGRNDLRLTHAFKGIRRLCWSVDDELHATKGTNTKDTAQFEVLPLWTLGALGLVLALFGDRVKLSQAKGERGRVVSMVEGVSAELLFCCGLPEP